MKARKYLCALLLLYLVGGHLAVADDVATSGDAEEPLVLDRVTSRGINGRAIGVQGVFKLGKGDSVEVIEGVGGVGEVWIHTVGSKLGGLLKEGEFIKLLTRDEDSGWVVGMVWFHREPAGSDYASLIVMEKGRTSGKWKMFRCLEPGVLENPKKKVAWIEDVEFVEGKPGRVRVKKAHYDRHGHGEDPGLVKRGWVIEDITMRLSEDWNVRTGLGNWGAIRILN